MGYAAAARRARDASLPLGARYLALRSCVAFAPVGYAGVYDELRAAVGVDDDQWSATQIDEALVVLEGWRAAWREIDDRWRARSVRRKRSGSPLTRRELAARDDELLSVGPGFSLPGPSNDLRIATAPPSDSFETTLADHLLAVRAVLPPARVQPSRAFDVRLDEWVSIPVRLYHPEPSAMAIGSLSPLQRTMLHCLYTRHADGFVRQRHLHQILPIELDLVVPYVVRLLGEYVVEIVVDIERGLVDLEVEGSALRDIYREFAARNPSFMDVTWQRAASYWSAYHRSDYGGPRSAGGAGTWRRYPAFDVLESIRGR